MVFQTPPKTTFWRLQAAIGSQQVIAFIFWDSFLECRGQNGSPFVVFFRALDRLFLDLVLGASAGAPWVNVGRFWRYFDGILWLFATYFSSKAKVCFTCKSNLWTLLFALSRMLVGFPYVTKTASTDFSNSCVASCFSVDLPSVLMIFTNMGRRTTEGITLMSVSQQ